MKLTRKGLLRTTTLFLTLAVAGAFAADTSVSMPNHADAGLQPEVLTNEGIVALANAGFSDSFIMEKIRLTDRTRLDVSVPGLSYLRRNAITENLVLFILRHNADPSTTSTSAPAATPAVVPTVVKSKLKMKKIAVPMESVNVMFVPAGSALSNPAGSAFTNSAFAPVLTQASSYSNPQPANPAPLKPQQMPVMNAAWWK